MRRFASIVELYSRPHYLFGQAMAWCHALTKKVTQMKTFLITLGFASALATTGFAQDTPAIEDTDGNGLLSMEEMQVVLPNLTEELFAAMDTNVDGQIDQLELDAAVAANLLAQ
ncbi:MAG: hypothetical protein ACJASV_000962 [Pseudorhodobacter sp.]|jgi:hypothetical protein